MMPRGYEVGNGRWVAGGAEKLRGCCGLTGGWKKLEVVLLGK